MQISPLLRWLLTGLASGVSAAGAALAAYDVVDPGVGITLAVLGAVFTGLGIVPPQVGGTQQGVISPSVTEPPAADIIER